MEIIEGKFGGVYYKYQKRYGAEHTLLLLHGLTGNSSIWNEHIEILKGNNVNFLNIDLVGHGNSYTPENLEEYFFEDQTEKIVKILELLEINNLTIVPYSYSTQMGPLLYEKIKEKTRGIIFVGPYFNREKGFKEKLVSGVIKIVWKYLIPDKKHYLDYSKLKNYERPTFWDNRYTFKSINTKDFLGSLYSSINFPQKEDLGIENIKVPMLIIYGKDDKMFPQKHRNVIGKLKDVKIKILENKEHLFLATNARVVAEDIGEFLCYN